MMYHVTNAAPIILLSVSWYEQHLAKYIMLRLLLGQFRNLTNHVRLSYPAVYSLS